MIIAQETYISPQIETDILTFFGLIWYNFKTEVFWEVFAMSGFFVNDKYRVLECMANRQISVNNEQIVKLSQQEIADILHFTKTKVNTIIGELKTNGYIVQLSSRGKYSLTGKANTELRKMGNKEAAI